MNRIWRHLSTSVTAFALLSLSAPSFVQAAESSVKLRGGDHDGYTRLVFEGQSSPHYTVSKTDESLILKFSAPATVEIEGGNPEALSRVDGYKVLDDRSVELDFPKGMSVRHFVIGNRIIVDLKGNAPQKKDTQKSASISPEKQVEKKEEAKPESKPEDLTKAIKDSAPPVAGPAAAAPASEQKQEPEPKVAEAVPPETDPAPIVEEKGPVPSEQTPQAEPQPAPEPVKLDPYEATMAGTTPFALAAFEKDGMLWVVIDKPDFLIPPQIEGKNPKAFGEFLRAAQKDVSIFKLKVPDGYKIQGDGGGLVWKILMNDGTVEKKFGAHPLYQNFDVEEKKPTPPKDGEEETTPKKVAEKKNPSVKFDAPSFRRTLELEDPDTGEKILLGLVDEAKDYTGGPQHFAEFETLPSFVGVALLSKVDDLSMTKTEGGAEISRPHGLSLSQKKDIVTYGKAKVEDIPATDMGEVSRIFDFKNWTGGGISSLADNQSLILSSLLDQTDARKTESLLGLGRMMLSNGFFPEAFGYFDLAQRYTPDMVKNPEFRALKSAAETLSGYYKDGFRGFNRTDFDRIGEVQYWKAFALSGLDDWQQAGKTLPDNVAFLKSYPDRVLWPFALKLAEVALRDGNLKKAEDILSIVEPTEKNGMPLAYKAELSYLEGELSRQKGDIPKAKDYWSALETGKDDLYRAKARLAMATLQYGRKEITIDKAIDSLEGLRYAWRGDELEASINFNLGRLYLEKGEPVRALGLMRQAANLIPNSEQGKMISQVMHATFQDLYMTDKIQALSPLEALTMYEEFSDLVPPGVEGDRLARQLAERLVDVDMLPRAISLLKKQVDTRVAGVEGASVATRLAALQIRNDEAQAALDTLDKADAFLQGAKPEEAMPKQRAIALLRAKAYSQLGKPKESFAALSLLPQDEDALRLRADIAWSSKKWQDAADAFDQLVAKQDISMSKPLTDEQAKLILNWGLSLYLADNRYVLANLRERYGDLMSKSKLAKEFEVVTRPRQNVLLADRATIQTVIGETDIFKDFLDSFKDDLTGPLPPESSSRPLHVKSASPSAPKTKAPMTVPDAIKETPELKADQVLGD